MKVMIGDLDDHLRKHAVPCGRNNGWRVPPARDPDLVSPEEEVRGMTIWISEERPDAGLDLARRAAPYSAAKPDLAEAIVGEVAGCPGWPAEQCRPARHECRGDSRLRHGDPG